jgi:hypothetical protein
MQTYRLMTALLLGTFVSLAEATPSILAKAVASSVYSNPDTGEYIVVDSEVDSTPAPIVFVSARSSCAVECFIVNWDYTPWWGNRFGMLAAADAQTDFLSNRARIHTFSSGLYDSYHAVATAAWSDDITYAGVAPGLVSCSSS